MSANKDYARYFNHFPTLNFLLHRIIKLARQKQIMPKIAKTPDGKTVYAYDIETEVLKPLKEGYYAESYARLDAMIDTALDVHLSRAYPNDCCQELLKNIEKAMKKEYAAVSGLVKARVLLEAKKIPKELYSKIVEFKGLRNRIVHDIEGADAMPPEKTLEAISKGIECFLELIKAQK